MLRQLDPLTRNAIRHTYHCLIGCGIGEILGSVIGAWRNWPNLWQTTLAIVLAFVFGYSLTFLGARRKGASNSEARTTALRTDTVSIISMEVIDNSLLWLLPGVMAASLASWLFWGSMFLSLGIAFVVTVPVNRWLMARSSHTHMHH